MRALVLGAGGFIGGHLVERLVSEGYWVRGVDIKPLEYRKSMAHEFVKGDLRDAAFTESVFTVEGNFDEVYQLAADMGGATYINSGCHDADVMSNSILINANVCKSSVAKGAKKIFFASSACVYPQNTHDSALCRECDVYPAFPDNEYGWEKLFSERMYSALQKQYNIIVRIARFHSVVGEYAAWTGGREKAHSALARKVAEVQDGCSIDVIGDGKQVRTFMYVQDCIDGVRALMSIESDIPVPIMNIGSNEVTTIEDYVKLLGKISQKTFTINYCPGPTGVKERYCDISMAKDKLKWTPKTFLEQSTRLTYNWIKKQMTVLFVTQSYGKGCDEKSHCGVGIRGKLTGEILSKHFILCHADSNTELERYIIEHKPTVIFYNYHSITTPWMNDSTLRDKYSSIKHVMIHYDVTQNMIDTFNPEKFHGFKHIVTDNEVLKTNNTSVFKVTRSLPRSLPHNLPSKNGIPKIGFQGFASAHKGIFRLAKTVQDEFDEAILRLHIPYSLFGDPNGDSARSYVQAVKEMITKPGIQVESSHEFWPDDKIVEWLSENDVNCYFLDRLENSGIASSPDYAIAARRPIAITQSCMLMHMWDLEPTICIEKTNLKTIIKNGIEPLKPLYEKYTHSNVINDYLDICRRLRTPTAQGPPKNKTISRPRIL